MFTFCRKDNNNNNTPVVHGSNYILSLTDELCQFNIYMFLGWVQIFYFLTDFFLINFEK